MGLQLVLRCGDALGTVIILWIDHVSRRPVHHRAIARSDTGVQRVIRIC
jgi:hypothetical protein